MSDESSEGMCRSHIVSSRMGRVSWEELAICDRRTPSLSSLVLADMMMMNDSLRRSWSDSGNSGSEMDGSVDECGYWAIDLI